MGLCNTSSNQKVFCNIPNTMIYHELFFKFRFLGIFSNTQFLGIIPFVFYSLLVHFDLLRNRMGTNLSVASPLFTLIAFFLQNAFSSIKK